MKTKLKKKTKKAARSIAKPHKPVPKLINLKVNKIELKLLVARAKRFAKGNMSLWLRHAGTKYTPKRKDLSP
jgi:hypothetical protein